MTNQNLNMDDISKILKKSPIKRQQNKNIHSEIHYWADVISSHFGERKKFAMYLGVIRRIGVDRAKQIFAEIKQSNVKSPGKLFVWKSKQNNKET